MCVEETVMSFLEDTLLSHALVTIRLSPHGGSI